MRTKSLTSLFGISLTALAITACGGDNRSNDKGTDSKTHATSTPNELTLKIATESGYKPFSYLSADGNAIGFEIDLMNALCEKIKATCDISSQDWDGLIPGLKAKKFDAIIAGMSITPDRQKVVDFTDPYFNSGIILIAKSDTDISADKLDGTTIGTQRSTVSSEYLEKNSPKADVKLYDTQENANIDLINGRVKGVVVDKVIGLEWLKNNADKGFSQKGDAISTGNDDMGIAVLKGNELAGKFNTALSELKANGTYDKISAKYFATVEQADGEKVEGTVEETAEDKVDVSQQY